MKSKTAKIILFSSLGIFIIFFIISIVTTYLKMSPFLNNLFEIGNKLENNQQLIDSTLVLTDVVSGNKLKVVLKNNKRVILRFWSIYDNASPKEITWVEENITKESLFVIVNDSLDKAQLFVKNKQFSFPIYYCDTLTLPFKHKNLIYPYSVVIMGDSITKSSLGNFNQIFKE